MPALKVKNKIRPEWSHVASTACRWKIDGCPDPAFAARPLEIDVHAYALATSSTCVEEQPYLPLPSSKAREVLQQLVRLQKLPLGFCGGEATPPSETVVVKASSFVLKADVWGLPLAFTAAGPQGEVVLVYTDDSLSAEVYFQEENPDEMILNKDEMILYKEAEPVYSDVIDLGRLMQHFG